MCDTNTNQECSLDNRVDVGLQTEFDDPDVYYFAGGRNIACQTDSCEQYGPLVPIPSGLTPVIIVLDPTDSDTEMSTIMEMDMDTSINEINTHESAQRGNMVGGCATPLLTEPASPATSHLIESCCDTAVNINTPTNIDTAVNTVVETKSSATQLSVGVLIEESADNMVPNDGSGDYNPKLKDEPSLVPEEFTLEVKKLDDKLLETASKACIKTTFADKARNGILRQSTLQAKSVPNNMNRIGTCSASKPGSAASLPKGKVPPSYRSNIASRCRTAVNTNKQQVNFLSAKIRSQDNLVALRMNSLINCHF